MEIRFAEPKDVSGILALLKQVGSLHHSLRPDLFRANAQKYGASEVLAMLNDISAPVFVAVEADRVLGYGFCKLVRHAQDTVLNDVTSLYIDDLCVDEACRGQGVGTALYGEISRYGKMRRCQSLTLNVWSCNKAALAFYEKMGLTVQKIGMEMPLNRE